MQYATTNTQAQYELVKDWPQLPAGFILGSPTGISIDSSGHLIVFHRAGRTWPLLGAMPKDTIAANTILVIDKDSGKLLNSWGSQLFIMPHGLTVDAGDNIWVTDVGLHQVFKFSHDGKLLLAKGVAKTPGNDAVHFNQPTDVAIARDGSFYVSDGYGNSRIIKFSAAGDYLFEWGTKGKKEGQFNIPHAIDLDAQGNVYVADRENNRVQVFNPSGKFIKQYNDKSFGRICSVVFDKIHNELIAVDDATSWFNLQHNGSDIICFDSTGTVANRFGRTGSYTGPKCWYHDLVIDKDRNIYVADILGNSIQKFKRGR